MYKVNFPGEQLIETAVERRRAAEAARKAQIFNTRLRVMGLDVDALNKQTKEKKRREEMEREIDNAFDKLRLKLDEALLQRDLEEREVRAALHADLTQYWSTHQRVQDSCDADLKCGLGGTFRIDVPEAELGPSSMRIFQGEDIGEGQRKREQIKKAARDLLEQKVDRERRCMEDKHREALAEKELLHQDHSWRHQHATEEEGKKAARVALDLYNQALAAERTERLKEQHRREESENLAEMWNAMTSNMMAECWDAAVKQLEGGRRPVVTDRWKGMSPEQLRDIQREREAQCIERQRRRVLEKNRDAAWNSHILKESREAQEEERRTAELRRAKRLQSDQFNKQLAQEQQAHQQYLNKQLYTNKPTLAYFHQFNTTSR
ncbi:RIB43A-like with coiled-coils protein 1 [Dunckerocampus dactyliophorus]|uniref:RIB43A-like with coiled-coils protein 1 n=1 Tax=Dunckerocampus dactyliophorus TaxID=161453 RepID=UPI002406EC3A|nr:RIB43A-like with coiled-coils protein 1 [Dunckerocampus dactyliophorus]